VLFSRFRQAGLKAPALPADENTANMNIQSSTYHQSAAVKRFIKNIQALGPRAAHVNDLSMESLIADARKATGLVFAGDESFLAPMRALLTSAQEEAELNAFGRAVVKAHTVRALKNRLWTHAHLARHPGIRERKIAAPIVIVGPHRSGTTRLHRMLASDLRFQHLKAWEGINPAPRAGRADLGKSSRYEEARKMLEGRERFYPGAFKAHPMHADWPEEESQLLNQSFCGFLPIGMYNVPGYYQWFINADKTFAYRHMADLMKLISAMRGEPEDKPWILKSPQHMLNLDALLSIFPDARLVFTHRDPIKTVGSVLSLMWHYAVQHTDAPCRAEFSARWLDFCERMARNCMRDRGKIAASQQTDVHYCEMDQDWRAVMRQLYHFIGLPFTPGSERSMAESLRQSEGGNQRDAHRYDLGDFGLRAENIDKRMMFVRECYGIPYETARPA
jgi:hypothetical protein